MQGSAAFVEILQLLLLWELSGWLDKKDMRSRGAGIAIPGSRKMHRQGWAVICSGVLTGADKLLFQTVDEARMVLRSRYRL